MPKYTVQLYYSTFYKQEIEANNMDDAIVLAREKEWSDKEKEELLNNMEPWEEADDVD